MIGDEEAKKELHYEETMWSTDQLQHGTLSIFSPGTLFHFGESLRTPFLNVHFAGTETAIRFSGYMVTPFFLHLIFFSIFVTESN